MVSVGGFYSEFLEDVDLRNAKLLERCYGQRCGGGISQLANLPPKICFLVAGFSFVFTHHTICTNSMNQELHSFCPFDCG